MYRRLEKHDIIIDAENGIPFFTPLYCRIPIVLLIYHVHRDVWHREYSWLPATIGKFLELKLMPFVYSRNRIVTISDGSKSEIQDLFRDATVSIVHCGVQENMAPGPKADHPDIVCVSRLKKYKNIDLVIRAVARIESPSLTLHVIGSGDDEQRLKDLAAELGLTNIIFHGFVSEAEKLAALQRAWISVNPSPTEGWGITNVEANACGTPAVGARVPGIRDSIMDNQTGLLFEPNDVDDLTQKLDLLIQDESLRKSLSEQGIKWAASFSWEKSATEFLEVIQEACGL
jgi:glycosyltransferase involved in cell wall biosynthesis